MIITTKEQLRDALVEAFDKKARRDVRASLLERAKPSPEHTARMRALLAVPDASPEPPRLLRLSPRRILIIALILILTAALVGCACYVGINLIGSDENEEYTSVFVILDSVDLENAPKSIEKVYVPKSIPEDFKLVQEIVDWSGVIMQYQNGENDWISYSQYCLTSFDIRMDNEKGNFTRVYRGAVEYYVHESVETKTYCWTNGEYFFLLQTPTGFSKTENNTLIDSIQYEKDIH